jgi:hypothetical protein
MEIFSAGYILFETMMAVMVFSIGILGVNRAMREAIAVRAYARDVTQARFLLENVISKQELQPELTASSDSGKFGGANSRFGFTWKVSKVEVPEPQIPADAPPEFVEHFKLSATYLAKIEATVSWTRNGREYKQTAQTLWSPEKLFAPEEHQKQ